MQLLDIIFRLGSWPVSKHFNSVLVRKDAFFTDFVAKPLDRLGADRALPQIDLQSNVAKNLE